MTPKGDGSGAWFRMPRLLAGLLAFALLAFAGCGSEANDETSSSGSAAEMTDVTFMADFTVPWVVQIPWVYALQNGWYEDAGLNVDYVLPQGTDAPARLLGTGKVDITPAYVGDMLSVNEKGLKVKVLMSLFDKIPGGVCFYDDSGIESPTDLEGKTAAVYNYPQSLAFWQHFYAANGVDPDAVNQVDAGANSAPLLISGKVDAIDAASPLECLTAELKKGQSTAEFPFDEQYGFPKTYYLMLTANAEWLAESDDAARKFTTVTQHAVSYCEDPDNQQECVQTFIDAYPDEVDPEVAEKGFESLKGYWCNGTASCWSPDKPTGYVDEKIWADLADFYADLGLIDDPATAPEVLTDNQYLSDEYEPHPSP